MQLEKNIIAGILGGPNSLEKFNRPVNDGIVNWVGGWVADELPVNIVMTDFYDRSGIIAESLEINAKKVAQQ